MKHTRQKQRLAFTLLETLTATVCTAVLMAGLASCLVIAGHVFDEDRMALIQQTRVSEPVDRMLSQMRYATGFSERTAHAVTFAVPDQDGDDLAESIRYAWSGTPGDPLTMVYNGGSPAVLVPAVQDLDLAFSTRTLTGTGFAQGEHLEVTAQPYLINSHVDAPGGRSGTFGTMPTYWYALYLEPNVPDGFSHWDFTQLQLSLKKSANADGYFAIQVCLSAEDPIGPATVLQELIVHESTLTNQYQWYEYNFDAVTGLNPDQPLFIVLKHAQMGGTQVMLGECEINIEDQPGCAMYHTQDVGETYFLKESMEMKFYAYGVAHP